MCTRFASAVISAVIILALGAAALAAEPGSVRLSIELPDRPTAGARLFVEKSCVRCHSLGGEESRVGPDLGRIHLTGTVLDIAGSFWNHSPVMREKMQDLRIPPPTMSSAEMADLLAFLTAYRYYLTELGTAADPAKGHTVFETKACTRCHGGPDSWEKLGPSLDRYRGRFSPIFLAQAMWNHGPEMVKVMKGAHVPWPKFERGEMGALLAYLQAGNGGTNSQRVYFEPGSPRRGRELFAAKHCGTCHTIAGVGGQGGPDLGARGRELVGSVSDIAGLMWNHTQGMAGEFQKRGLTHVKFSGEEMADIIAYLYFVNYANVRGTPARGAELFAGRCASCHHLEGTVGLGPNLARLPQLDDPIAIVAAMWNHASRMETETRKLGLTWPRFEPGDTADLTAFLLQKRSHVTATGETSDR